MTVRVFVYGTLKRGERNHARMQDAAFVGRAVTREAKFAISEYQSASFPGRLSPAVSLGGKLRIAGETDLVDEALLTELDVFEAVGVHYERRSVDLADGRSAEMYRHLATSGRNPGEGTSGITILEGTGAWSEPPAAHRRPGVRVRLSPHI